MKPLPTPTPETNRSPEPSQRLEHRFVLSDKKTDWFSRNELTTMMKKYEGRIITIENRS